MSSPAAAAGGVMPALPPIKTRAVDACASSSASPFTVEVGEMECTATTAGEVVEEAEATTTVAAVAEEAEATTTVAAVAEEADEEPRTPTSVGSKLRSPAECPPAPRKPAWTTTMPAARRKAASTSSTSSSSSSSLPGPSSASAKRRPFFDVPRDLSAVFRSLPPKKRIRAG